jgi:hypothetical protein
MRNSSSRDLSRSGSISSTASSVVLIVGLRKEQNLFLTLEGPQGIVAPGGEISLRDDSPLRERENRRLSKFLLYALFRTDDDLRAPRD